MEIIFNGIKLGIVLAFLIGPVFFTIIQTSVERGFWNGVLVSLGVSLSDILYVTICYFGVIQFINDPNFRESLAYVGGGILGLFGLYHLFIKSRRNIRVAVAAAEGRKMYRYFVKGFIINGLSPMVLIFWIGTISVASLDFGYSHGYEFFIFFSIVLITVLATDILKAYLADKLRRLVTRRLMMIMNVIVGICLIIFGARLIFLAGTF
ncbi:MAG: LysE family transporter [Cyclobacteriaceae bacterium]|nr:LysE family transporter [Cyclobacteriaceae bacterium]